MYLLDFMNQTRSAPDHAYVCCSNFKPLAPVIDRDRRGVCLVPSAKYSRIRDFEKAVEEAAAAMGNVGRVFLAPADDQIEAVQKIMNYSAKGERQAVVIRKVTPKPKPRPARPSAEIGPEEEV